VISRSVERSCLSRIFGELDFWVPGFENAGGLEQIEGGALAMRPPRAPCLR